MAIQIDEDNAVWMRRIGARDGYGGQSRAARAAINAWIADPDDQYQRWLAMVQTPSKQRLRRSFCVDPGVYRALNIEALDRRDTIANIVNAAMSRYRFKTDDGWETP